MRIHSEEEIIEKGLQKIATEANAEDDMVDVAVDLEDKGNVVHSYVVTFRKNSPPAEPEWSVVEITEISAW